MLPSAPLRVLKWPPAAAGAAWLLDPNWWIGGVLLSQLSGARFGGALICSFR